MMDHIASIKQEFHEAAQTLQLFMSEEKNFELISDAIRLMVTSLQQGGKIISCGNGGSMCDAMHFAEELSGRFRDDRAPIAAMAISDPSHLSCVANDYGYEYVFSRAVQALGRQGDVLLAISTSGNSANVVAAARMARELNMQVIGLTGKDGGLLAGLCDVEIRTPLTPYADRVQEIHIKVIHCLIQGIEQSL
jgi:D-sedoheptulose 7-phosphate isomerase